jgi:small subunit ribosomal protein S6
MRIYEDLFIVRPDASDEEIDQLIGQLKQLITDAGGTIDKEEKWGKRRLAYRVEKRDDGFYVLLQFSSGPEVVKELERRMRVSDLVLKYLTVRMDLKLQRLAKKKKRREKRAQRKPMAAAAAPQQPAVEQIMAEAAAEEKE